MHSNYRFLVHTIVLNINAYFLDNIMYGDLTRTVSQEEVIAAAKSANIHDFIDSLPEVKYI